MIDLKTAIERAGYHRGPDSDIYIKNNVIDDTKYRILNSTERGPGMSLSRQDHDDSYVTRMTWSKRDHFGEDNIRRVAL